MGFTDLPFLKSLKKQPRLTLTFKEPMGKVTFQRTSKGVFEVSKHPNRLFGLKQLQISPPLSQDTGGISNQAVSRAGAAAFRGKNVMGSVIRGNVLAEKKNQSSSSVHKLHIELVDTSSAESLLFDIRLTTPDAIRVKEFLSE